MGNTTNTNLGTAIQEAITGSADVTFASGTVTLTLTDTNATQTARKFKAQLNRYVRRSAELNCSSD
jgi:hypothetical protein